MPLVRSTAALLRREVLRFLRDRHRVVGSVATPLVFWLFLGTGLDASFRVGGESYRAYFLPGILVLVAFFTAIFSTITVVEDRREGFLQGVLVSPAPRASIVLGKTLGGALLGLLHAGPLLLLCPLAGIPLGPARFLAAASLLAGISFALSALGLLIAWRMESAQGFHAVMNLLLMPMWFLSGAVFPPDGAPPWLRLVMAANPVSYAVSALRGVLGVGAAHPLGRSLAALALFAAAALAASVASVRRPAVRDLA